MLLHERPLTCWVPMKAILGCALQFHVPFCSPLFGANVPLPPPECSALTPAPPSAHAPLLHLTDNAGRHWG